MSPPWFLGVKLILVKFINFVYIIYMNIGSHVSSANGLWNAPYRARDFGLDTFQMFSRSPHGGKASVFDKDVVEKFKNAMKECEFKSFVIHAPYYTNLGSANNRIYYGTISAIREELERGSLLGAEYVMFHPGSFKDLGEKEGMKKVISGIDKVLDGYSGSTKLLVEISAGAGEIAGDSFRELGEMLFGNKKYLGKSLAGICFDTQHAFASGYDLREKKAIKKVFENFDKTIGLKYLKLIHANDSKVEFGGKKDRHEHIGDGFIGIDGFKELFKYLKSKKIDVSWILETQDDKKVEDVEKLKAIFNG